MTFVYNNNADIFQLQPSCNKRTFLKCVITHDMFHKKILEEIYYSNHFSVCKFKSNVYKS